MTNSDEGAIYHSREHAAGAPLAPEPDDAPADPDPVTGRHSAPPDWTLRMHRPPSPAAYPTSPEDARRPVSPVPAAASPAANPFPSAGPLPAAGSFGPADPFPPFPAADRFPAASAGSARMPVAGPVGPFPAGYDPRPVPPAFVAPIEARRTPRWRRRVALVVAAALLAASSGVIGAATVTWLDRGQGTAQAASGTPVTTVANSGTTTITGVVKAVDAQVVSIDVRGGNVEDLGSGVVVRSDGLILTNNHVIAAAAQGGSISVTFTDGTTVRGTVVAADAQQDLALVRASGVSGRSAATFAASGALRVGDTVVAIGNELGLSNSVTAGIVSALHRQVTVAADASGGRGTTYPDAIQTDASINQGDSGGALYNLAGQVVGINTAIATASSTSTGSVGVGFAITSDDASAFLARALGGGTS